MTQNPDPRRWSTALLKFAISVLVAVVSLNLAVRLLLAIAPVLLGIIIAVLVSYITWSIVRFRRSRW